MYGGDNSGMPLGPDPVNNGTGTFSAENDYDQPAAIVSGGDDGGAVAFDSSKGKDNNSAKYFGHRSRGQAAKAATPQVDMNLVAASNIASNPNNPEFFRQAAAQSATEQIQRQPRQINKKPFIVGGIAVIIIAVVAIFATTILPTLLDNQKKEEQVAAEQAIGNLSEILSEVSVADIEYGLVNMYNGGFSLSSSSFSDATYENIKTKFPQIINLNESLAKINTSGMSSEDKKLFENIKNAISDRAEVYGKIYNAYELLYLATYKGEVNSKKELLSNSNSTVAERAKILIEAYEYDQKLMSEYERHSCGGNSSAYCKDLDGKITENDKLLTSKNALSQYFKAFNDDKELSLEGGINDNVNTLALKIEGANTNEKE